MRGRHTCFGAIRRRWEGPHGLKPSAAACSDAWLVGTGKDAKAEPWGGVVWEMGYWFGVPAHVSEIRMVSKYVPGRPPGSAGDRLGMQIGLGRVAVGVLTAAFVVRAAPCVVLG